MKYCPYCGSQISNDTVFCPNCGHKVSGDNQQQNQFNSNYQSQPNYNNNYSTGTNPGYMGQKVRITPRSCGMIQAFTLFWNNYVNFGGYSSRSEYWWVMLCHFIIFIICLFLCLIVIGKFLLFIYGLAIIIPNLSLLSRRMRDAGIPNGWIIALLIINFIPYLDFISGIATFVISLMPSVRIKSSQF